MFVDILNEPNSLGLPIVFYSNNCAGQNNIKFIAKLYMYTTMILNIPSIIHKFLLYGHCKNEGNAIYCIENEKKYLKNGSIYVPEQWVSITKYLQ